MTPTEKLTRSKILKRAGVGAAAAWTVPMFVTTSGAAADVMAPGGKACLKQNLAGGPAACSACENLPSCPGNCCHCFVDKKGCCTCRNNFFCSDSQDCNNNGQCPPGWVCGHSCCRPQSHCLPPCGGIPCPSTASGATGAG